ncbi:MAG TPA: hypothetical protein VJB09_01330 [Candidatus Paceibacterota bacterium]
MGILGILGLITVLLVVIVIARQTGTTPTNVNIKLVGSIVGGVILFTVIMGWTGYMSHRIFWAFAAGIALGIAIYYKAWELVGSIVVIGIIIFAGLSIYNQFWSDQLIAEKKIRPGEIWTTTFVNYVFFTRGEEGREYEVKFTGCTEFLRFKTLENGATVAIPPCAKQGSFQIRLVPGDTEPMKVQLWKDR